MQRLRAALESLDDAISDLTDIIVLRQNALTDQRVHVELLADSLDDTIVYLEKTLHSAR